MTPSRKSNQLLAILLSFVVFLSSTDLWALALPSPFMNGHAVIKPVYPDWLNINGHSFTSYADFEVFANGALKKSKPMKRKGAQAYLQDAMEYEAKGSVYYALWSLNRAMALDKKDKDSLYYNLNLPYDLARLRRKAQLMDQSFNGNGHGPKTEALAFVPNMESVLQLLQTPGGERDIEFEDVAIDPSFRFVAYRKPDDSSLYLLNLESWSIRKIQDGVIFFTFSVDGERLVFLKESLDDVHKNDSYLGVYDLQTGIEKTMLDASVLTGNLKAVKDSNLGIYRICWGDNSERIISEAHSVGFRRNDQYTEYQKNTIHSPNSQYSITFSDAGLINIFAYNHEHPLRIDTFQQGIQGIEFSPDGRVMAVLSGQKVVLYHLPEVGAEVPRLADPKIILLDFQPKTNPEFSRSAPVLWLSKGAERMAILDRAGGVHFFEDENYQNRDSHVVQETFASPGENHVAQVLSDNRINIYTSAGLPVSTLNQRFLSTAQAVLASAQYVFTIHDEQKGVRIWNTNTGELLATLGQESTFRQLAWSGNLNKLVAVNSEGQASIFHLNPSNLQDSRSTVEEGIRSAMFGQSGERSKLYLSTLDNQVIRIIWKGSEDQSKGKRKTHRPKVLSLQNFSLLDSQPGKRLFLDNGRLILTGSGFSFNGNYFKESKGALLDNGTLLYGPLTMRVVVGKKSHVLNLPWFNNPLVSITRNGNTYTIVRQNGDWAQVSEALLSQAIMQNNPSLIDTEFVQIEDVGEVEDSWDADNPLNVDVDMLVPAISKEGKKQQREEQIREYEASLREYMGLLEEEPYRESILENIRSLDSTLVDFVLRVYLKDDLDNYVYEDRSAIREKTREVMMSLIDLVWENTIPGYSVPESIFQFTKPLNVEGKLKPSVKREMAEKKAQEEREKEEKNYERIINGNSTLKAKINKSAWGFKGNQHDYHRVDKLMDEAEGQWSELATDPELKKAAKWYLYKRYIELMPAGYSLSPLLYNPQKAVAEENLAQITESTLSKLPEALSLAWTDLQALGIQKLPVLLRNHTRTLASWNGEQIVLNAKVLDYGLRLRALLIKEYFRSLGEDDVIKRINAMLETLKTDLPDQAAEVDRNIIHNIPQTEEERLHYETMLRLLVLKTLEGLQGFSWQGYQGELENLYGLEDFLAWDVTQLNAHRASQGLSTILLPNDEQNFDFHGNDMDILGVLGADGVSELFSMKLDYLVHGTKIRRLSV